MKTAVQTGNKVSLWYLHQVLQKRHMKEHMNVLMELSKQEIAWQSHGGRSLPLIRQQPLTEQ